jgi:hypothetical protein
MRNILALIGLVVVGFGVGGWYLGWYKLSVAKSTDGNLQIKTDVDTKKVGTDSTEFMKNVGSAIGTQVDKAGQDARTAPPAGTPGSTPGPVNSQGTDINPMTPMTGTPIPTIPTIPSATPPVRNPGTIPLVAPKPNN